MTGDSGQTFTDVTAPTSVGEGDENVLGTSLGTSVEGTYIDETYAVDSGAATLSDLPLLTADVTSGEYAAWVALAAAGATGASDATLSSVTISGVPSGWSLSDDGAASIPVTPSGTGTGPTGTVMATTSFAVMLGAAVEAPSVTLTTSGSGSLREPIAPSGIGDSGDTSASASPPGSGTASGGSGGASGLVTPAAAVTTATIDPTVAINGTPVEGTTLTASAGVTGGFTGTTEFHWQRFYAGSWWNIPIELSPYTAGETFTFEASPTYVVREEDENVSAIRVELDLVDPTGITVATADSPSIGPVLDEPATLALSPITGSPVEGATLTVSAQVVTDEGTFTPLLNWQRFYSGGWWDIPIELSPYSSGEALTFVTTPTYVVRAEDTNVLAIRVEGTYADDTGQTFTITDGAETISEPPPLTAADVTLGENVASVALAITVAAQDTDYTLGGVTISGVPSGWSLSGDGATSIAGGTWTVGSGGLGGLTLVAPSTEAGTFTLSVTASETALGPNGTQTATATTSFAVTVTDFAEAPGFGATASWSGGEEAPIALSGLSATGDADDALSATLSGIPSLWTVRAGETALTGGEAFAASDLGSLVVTAPDGGGETANLTLTVTSGEGSNTATGSEVLTVVASGVAEAPAFGATASWSGGEEAPIALSGLSATGDADDALSATLSGIPSLWTVRAGATALTGGEAFAASDLGSLVVTAPDGGGETANLTLTVTSGEGSNTATGSEVLTVVASGVAEAPAFGATASWSGGEEAPIALSGLSATGDADDALSATLSGIPSLWTVRAGETALTGGEAFAASDLGSLVVTAPDGGGETANLTLTVTSGEGSNTATGSEVLTVVASGVAEAPGFGATASWSGGEEAPIALSGLSATGDPDDALSATLSGIPSLWTVRAGETALTGGEAFAASDLGSLVVTAPDGGGETANLTLTVTSGEGSNTATGSEVLTVVASGVAEAPAFGATASWSGGEEAPIALSGLSATGDADDALSATLSGIPSLWTVRAGETALTGGEAFAASDLGSLVVTAPDGGGETANLTLTVTSGEGSNTATGSEVLTVVASGVAEAPGFGATASWSGGEEAPIALSGLSATGDPDDALSATLSGIPSLWTVRAGETALTGGEAFAASDLGSLVVTAPDGGGETANLTLTVTSGEGSNTATGSEVLTVVASGVAEAPAFGATASWSGGEEAPIALSGLSATGDADDALSATLSGIPSLWTVRAGATALTGGEAFAASDLGSLVVTAPDGGGETANLTLTVTSGEGSNTATGSEVLTVVASGVAEAPGFGATASWSGGEEAPIALSGLSATGDPDDALSATLSGIPSLWTVRAGATALTGGEAFAASDLGSLVVTAPDGGGETANLTLTVTSGEGSNTATGSEVLTVVASGVAEAPGFGATASWSGGEEAPIALSGLSATGDADDALSATLSGIPSLWTVRAGATALTGGEAFAASDLGSLVVTAPDGGGETANLTLTVTSGEGSNTATGSEVLTVVASGVAEAPGFGATASWSGGEEAPIALSGLSATGDADDALSATLSGIPSLWTVRAGATALTGGEAFAASDLGSLVVTAPDGGGETANLTLTVTSGEGSNTATGSEVLTVVASGVAEAPAFGATASWSGGEEAPIALSGLSATGDADDALSATLSGIPSLWTVRAGETALTGGEAFAASDLGSLVVTAPDGGGETANLTLTVTSGEGSNTATGSEVLTVVASGVAEAPGFGATASWSGGEEAPIALSGLSATGDADDALSATLSGIPSLWTVRAGATALTGGEAFAASDLGSLVVTAPDGGGETANLTLTVTSGEGSNTATGSEVLTVVASGVAEAPAFGATASWSGGEEAPIALSGLSATGDADDALSATLSGIPSLWTVRAGETALTGGEAFAASDLGSLVVTAPDGGGETANLTLTVTSGEGSNTATGSEVLTVVASGVAEAPGFGATASWSGGESVTLSGLSATGDPDDTLSATFAGLSSGWTLVDTHSTSSFTGTSITAIPVSDLGSLVVVAPGATASATDLLTLTISSSEGGTTASGSEILAVTATAIAEPPNFSGPTIFYGGTSVTLSSLGASPVDGDTLGPDVTITGLSTSWTLVDTHSTSSFTGASITAIPVSDLGSLVVVPPSATSFSVTDVLTLTIPSSLGASTTSGSEVLSLVAQKYTSLSGNETGANLTNADLSGADLRLVDLTGATLSGATLTNADLTGATLTNANLSGADLSGATLHNASGGGADLSGADLAGADLHNTGLTSATLVGADLLGADLHNANLTDATLTGADLRGANFNSANLTGTTFPLQLSLLGASAGGHDVTGDVADGFTGAVTITAVDNGTTLGSVAISYSSTAAPEAWSIGNVTFAQGGSITVTARDSEGAFYSASGTVVAAAPAGVAGSPINLALSDPSGGAPIAVAIAGIPEGWSLNAGSDLGNGTWTVETSDPSALAISPSGGFVGAVVLPVTESWIKADGSSASQYLSDNVEAYSPGNPIFALSSADTLTGSGANDLFVFARPIGNDRIYDFKTASNRIDLIGFSGISSFADLQSKMANDANGDAVLTLGSGETITIVGVDAASLGAANFMFNEEPTTSNAGAMAIGDGATLPLGGAIDNAGTIALASAGDKTELVVLSGGVTLEGGGEVTLSDNAGNAIVGNGADTTLTNLDNIISGAGRLGDASMTLGNAGVIDATGVNPLIIDTGGNSISNSGAIEATGAGELVIGGAVANSGTLSADGGKLIVDGAVTGAGIASIAGTGTVEFGAASAENTSFASGAAGTLRLDHSAAFSGTVSGFAGGDAIDLADLAFGSNTALGYTDNGAGSGVVTIGNGMQVVDLALLGQYAAAGFHAQSDPGGGTLITYTLQTSSTDVTSLTNLGHQP